MREHVLLFCLLGLVLTATIMLVAAPGAVNGLWLAAGNPPGPIIAIPIRAERKGRSSAS
jgi:hypothetical protein